MAATPSKKLSERALKVVNAIEQAFWEGGSFPTYEVIAVRVKETEKFVQGVVEKNPVARRALVARGVDLNPEKSAQVLDAKQLMAANLVLNSHDKRSLREKLDLVGVSSQQWHAWLRQPGFSQYLTKRAEAAFEANDFAAYGTLADNIEDGSLDAVKFHFEMRGKYKNTLDVNINIESVIMNVVEIIAKHVKDPEVINAIADDIGRLDVGSDNNGMAAPLNEVREPAVVPALNEVGSGF